MGSGTSASTSSSSAGLGPNARLLTLDEDGAAPWKNGEKTEDERRCWVGLLVCGGIEEVEDEGPRELGDIRDSRLPVNDVERECVVRRDVGSCVPGASDCGL